MHELRQLRIAKLPGEVKRRRSLISLADHPRPLSNSGTLCLSRHSFKDAILASGYDYRISPPKATDEPSRLLALPPDQSA